MKSSFAAKFAGRTGVCIPSCNAGTLWRQRLTEVVSAAAGFRLLVIDSDSDDDTARTAREAGCEVIVIARHEFNHGATRNRALEVLSDCEVVIFMTQDALPAEPQALARLIEAFDDPDLAAAYGRQLPHTDATPVAAHARCFNYPQRSHRVSPEQMRGLGIKAAFLSNSFTAYRRRALVEAGGFPDNAILGEDMVAGARLLRAGWQLAYCAEARVYHSHNYSQVEEFRRYFDIGVLHTREHWILDMTGRAEEEGQRFVVSELRYLRRRQPGGIPAALLRNALKYLGYRLGRAERWLPTKLKRHLSMQPGYWQAGR
ncbi:glycosyltransferase [Kushneria aurantia]|uniref:Glycosyltransferase n=2 Tax=Kushneria aurantia TaxID=504092 RepID=A0ABV6FYX9_9GAMM|nr:glycosyltransferase family 2 protein [Kushneria aurantia]